jgi:hypothetical protein
MISVKAIDCAVSCPVETRLPLNVGISATPEKPSPLGERVG